MRLACALIGACLYYKRRADDELFSNALWKQYVKQSDGMNSA
jgi:hypothetical protein